MQDNLYCCYPWYEESSGSHHSENAAISSAASIDITSVHTYTSVPVNLHEWSPVVTPIIGNSDSSLAALSSVAENLGCVAHASCHQTALNCARHIPLMSCDCSTDAHLRAQWAAAEVEIAPAYAPQTAWNWRGAVLTQLDRSQVPSGTTDLDDFGKSWSQRGDDGHAVEAPAQPTFLHYADHPLHPMPAWSYMPGFPEVSASSTSQAHITDLGNVSSWMAGPVLGQAPSLSNHRRYHRRPRARPEHVFCDKCQKPMRRQSLRRHIREVHDHIKRPHSKSSFAAGPQF